MSTSSSTATYSDCVASLRTSLSFLESSVATLGAGVQDFPRLSSILKTVRVRFLPLPYNLGLDFLGKS
jgi:DASH complex subunit SPC19